MKTTHLWHITTNALQPFCVGSQLNLVFMRNINWSSYIPHFIIGFLYKMATCICKISVQNHFVPTSVVFKDWVTWFLASAMLPPKVKYLIKTTCNLLKRYSIHMYYMYYYVNKISLYSTVISQ